MERGIVLFKYLSGQGSENAVSKEEMNTETLWKVWQGLPHIDLSGKWKEFGFIFSSIRGHQ